MECTKFDPCFCRKWRSLVIKYAFKAQISTDDAWAIAMEAEWEAQQKFPDDPVRVERYLLYRGSEATRKKRAEAKQEPLGCLLWHRIREQGTDWYNKKHITNSFPELNDDSSLIDQRGFDAQFYDHLIQHMVSMLSQIDDIVSEIFLARVFEYKQWQEIAEEHPQLSHRKFSWYVKVIKETAKDYYIQQKSLTSKEKRWIISLLR